MPMVPRAWEHWPVAREDRKITGEAVSVREMRLLSREVGARDVDGAF